MKFSFLRASPLLAATIAAGPAFAQDTDTLVVQSLVPPYCSEFQTNQAPLELGTLTGATGQIVTSFNGTTEREVAARFYCNAPATVTIKAVPLMHDTITLVSDSTSFTNRVDYVATLVWDDVTGNVSSTVTAGQVIQAPEANIGAMLLRLSDPAVANNLRPVAGDYNGQVTLTVALAQ